MPANGGRKVKKWNVLYPQTSTKPIQLSEYVREGYRDRVVNDSRLTPEYKAWYDKRAGKYLGEK